jgi:nucleotide-binding universal stress UspA family protein
MENLETSATFLLRNILFLTDLTEASQTASMHAVALARRFGSRLYPAHVVLPRLSAADDPPDPQHCVLATEARIHSQLMEIMPETGVPYDPLVCADTIENAVRRWSVEYSIDLIVAGTHGRRGVQWRLLGSTAEAILRAASCPVLTVGPHATHGLGANGKIRQLLFVTGMPAASRQSVSYALSLAREEQAQMTVLHVLPENTSYGYRSGSNDVERHERHRLFLPEEHVGCDPELIVEKGSIEERAVHHAVRGLPDLVVLAGSRNNGFSTLGPRVTYKIISASPSAVLTLPVGL